MELGEVDVHFEGAVDGVLLGVMGGTVENKISTMEVFQGERFGTQECASDGLFMNMQLENSTHAVASKINDNNVGVQN